MNLMKLLAPDFWPGRVRVRVEQHLDFAARRLRSNTPETRELIRLIATVKPWYTMAKNKNLALLHELAGRVAREGVPGDLVECGVWNGGSAAVTAKGLGEAFADRVMWLFDSFEGVPRPGERDGVLERKYYFEGWNKGAVENVKAIFDRLGLPWARVHIERGWFQDTLPQAKVERIALLHVDADWYDSVMQVLDTLYDRVSPGGFVVFDDYGSWQGCRRAADDFLSKRGLRVRLERQSRAGAWFQKPQTEGASS